MAHMRLFVGSFTQNQTLPTLCFPPPTTSVRRWAKKTIVTIVKWPSKGGACTEPTYASWAERLHQVQPNRTLSRVIATTVLIQKVSHTSCINVHQSESLTTTTKHTEEHTLILVTYSRVRRTVKHECSSWSITVWETLEQTRYCLRRTGRNHLHVSTARCCARAISSTGSHLQMLYLLYLQHTSTCPEGNNI